MKIKVHISCCMCSASHSTTAEFPDGWKERYDSIESEQGFCPKHVKIAAFSESQCPGCVGGWGECGLWSGFAYAGSTRNLTEKDLADIETGICPRRTNGTFSVGIGEGRLSMEDIDLREGLDPEAGKAFADGIREYWVEYPDRHDS